MTLNLPQNLSSTIEQFTGRSWVLMPLLKWLDETSDHFFVIRGKPGSGKSMLLAWLSGYGPAPEEADDRANLERFRAYAKSGAIHFCRFNSPDISPRIFAKDVAGQLAANVPGFQAQLEKSLAGPLQLNASVLQDVGTVQSGGTVVGLQLNLSGYDEESSFNRALYEPLKKLIEGGHMEPIVLMVDALDEAITYSGPTNIVRLLARFQDLSPQIRILVTTRPEERVFEQLPLVRVLDVVQDRPVDTDDIQTYANQQLGSLTDVQRSELARRIAEEADGVFLYAFLVVPEVRAALARAEDPETITLPKGLAEQYRRFLSRELTVDSRRWFDVYKPLLGTLAIAQGGGLTRDQLKRIVKEDLTQALLICQQYVSGERPNGPFRIFHQSFAEFLLDADDNPLYVIDSAGMNQRISTAYQSSCQGHWETIDAYGIDYLLWHLVRGDVDGKLQAIHDDLYAIRHLFYHMVKAERVNEIGKVVDLALDGQR